MHFPTLSVLAAIPLHIALGSKGLGVSAGFWCGTPSVALGNDLNGRSDSSLWRLGHYTLRPLVFTRETPSPRTRPPLR
jgi:hypothetical protein